MMTSNAHYPTLFSTQKVGSHTLSSRLIMSSMHLGLEEYPGGFERMAAFYAERVKGGAGIIITGGISPNDEGVLGTGGAAMNRESEISKHRIITNAVHQEGGLILLQLLHAGRYTKDPILVAPSPIRAPINRFEPREMSEQDILRTIEDFASATKLAIEAGYDGVEVMGSEGYLINEFLTPATNTRTDAWGGSLENRQRFALDVVRRVRETLGNKLLSYRISVTDLIPGGNTLADNIDTAKKVQDAGADLFVTGVGWHESRVPTIATSVPRAAFVEFTSKLKAEVKIPVAATNRINTPEKAEQILASGQADLVALARPFLADPQFGAKAKAGRGAEINTCIACNQACLDHIFADKLASCLVNPRAGRETELRLLPTKLKKRVAVVGGGVAGLSAATHAASRGFKVTIFEKRQDIGGQFDMAMRIPGKEEFKETLRYYRGQIELLGIDVKLAHSVTAAELKEFDEVIIATGVKPRIPNIKGADLPNVLSYPEVLRGEKEVGKNVVILGAGGIGFDMAEFLTQVGEANSLNTERFQESWGIIVDQATPGNVTQPQIEVPARNVTMLQRKTTKMGAGLGLTTGWIHKAEIARRGVQTLIGVQYDEITNDGINITVDGEAKFLPADTVVLCTGQESVLDLVAELESAGIKPHIIGGAKLAGELDAKRAISEGAEVADSL